MGSPYPSFRVPLHPDDADYNQGVYDRARWEAEDLESAMRRQDLHRLAAIAEGKRAYDRHVRGRGPGEARVPYGGLEAGGTAYDGRAGERENDQERGFQHGTRVANRRGATGRTAGYQAAANVARLVEWASSEPRTRNAYLHAMLIPENTIYGAMEALATPETWERPREEVLGRLAMALPGAIWPEVGYPIQPARDRMYEELGPIFGTAADFAMPGLEIIPKASNAARFGSGAPTFLEDKFGNAIRRLRNSPEAPRLRLQYAQ
jgi:hypothetical protein